MKHRLSETIDEFLLFRKSQGLAQNTTLRNERSSLTAFLTVTGNLYVESVNDRHVTEFLAEASKRRSPNSLGNDIGTLRIFFAWCRRTRRMPERSDPMAGRKAPKRQERERARVHVSQFPALLDAAEARCERDRAFLALLLYTCCRTSEVSTLRINDVDLDAGYITVRIMKSKLEDRLGIPTELDRELRRWLTYYATKAGPLQPDWYLTPARQLLVKPGLSGRDAPMRLEPTRPITHTAANVVKPALEGIGFTVPGRADLKGEGAHTIRRSSARALFDTLVGRGYDHALRLVGAQLHHRNTEMTERYLGIAADRYERDKILKGESMFGLPEVTRIGGREPLDGHEEGASSA